MGILDNLSPDDVTLGRVEETAKNILIKHLADDNQMLIPPVNLNKLAENLGVQVREARLHDLGPSLLAKEEPDLPPIIYLDKDTSHIRQRFALAHELGHYVEQTAQKKDHFDTLFRGEGRGDNGTSASERWANRFAAAILMPADVTMELYASGKTTKEIAERFNVSTMAANIRLAQLGLS